MSLRLMIHSKKYNFPPQFCCVFTTVRDSAVCSFRYFRALCSFRKYINNKFETINPEKQELNCLTSHQRQSICVRATSP